MLPPAPLYMKLFVFVFPVEAMECVAVGGYLVANVDSRDWSYACMSLLRSVPLYLRVLTMCLIICNKKCLDCI